MIQHRNARGRRGSRVDWEELLVAAVGALWQWRFELIALLALVGVHRLVARVGGESAATALVALLGVAAVALTPSRRLCWRALRSGWLRRGWERATADAGLSEGPWRGPRMLAARQVRAGDVLRVRVRRGQSVAALEARAAELAACLRVREVRVEPETGDAAVARVTLVRRDPFAGSAPLPWPNAAAEVASLWEPIPVGVDEHGEAVSIRL